MRRTVRLGVMIVVALAVCGALTAPAAFSQDSCCDTIDCNALSECPCGGTLVYCYDQPVCHYYCRCDNCPQ
jgi:hypothetical protein